MGKIDWIIHYVSERACDLCEKESDDISYEGFPAFGNIHTHGLNLHGHRELCIPFGLPSDIAMGILNGCGLQIVDENKEFNEGIYSGILKNGYDVKFISFDNDPTLYMILPDKNNKFPEDADCEFPYNQQEFYAKIISDDKDYV